jgi:integrase
VRLNKLLPSRKMKRKKFSEIVKHGISFAKKNYADASTFLVAITLAIAKFGPRIADKITGKEIENWLNKLQEERGWTNSTWNHWLTYLSMTFREAKRKGDVTVNPAHLARRKRVVESKVRFVTEEEEMRLRAAIVEPRGGFPKDNESCEAQLVTAIYTGMRRKEQFSMVWNQVDLERGLIFLPNTKPGESAYVELNSYVIHVLQMLKDRYGPSGPAEDARVFPIDNPTKWFQTALKAAGIQGVTWHTLRHTFASRLTMKGVNLKTVQELLRHRSIEMAARYSHLAPIYESEALETLVNKQPISYVFGCATSSRELAVRVPPAVQECHARSGPKECRRLSLIARVDRRALYEEVWSAPLRNVAKHYEVSDVALAKACRRLKIPVPGRGYWNKIAAHLPVPPRPPLPPLDSEGVASPPTGSES